jgi:hypothetical protein
MIDFAHHITAVQSHFFTATNYPRPSKVLKLPHFWTVAVTTAIWHRCESGSGTHYKEVAALPPHLKLAAIEELREWD